MRITLGQSVNGTEHPVQIPPYRVFIHLSLVLNYDAVTGTAGRLEYETVRECVEIHVTGVVPHSVKGVQRIGQPTLLNVITHRVFIGQTRPFGGISTE